MYQGAFAKYTKVASAATPATYTGPDGESLGFWPSVRAHTTRQLIGHPSRVARELGDGSWRQRGSYTRQSLWPSLPVDKGAGPLTKGLAHLIPTLMYLPAALSIYGALRAPEEARGEATGNVVGSLVGALAGSPFGVLGSTALSVGGGMLGSRAGRSFQREPNPSTYYDASAQGPA